MSDFDLKDSPKVVSLRHGNCLQAIRVDRSSKWGNPFMIGKHGTREQVVAKYKDWILTQSHLLEALPELKGKDLACWCSPEPCHGDILLELANKGKENNVRDN